MDVAWSVDSSTYASKVALCIAGKDLPDVLVVNRSTFKQMADNDLLADLTEVYDSCISDFLRAQLDSYGEGLMKEVTVTAKLLGIPSPSLNNCQNVLWIRSDWLEKAGLEGEFQIASAATSMEEYGNPIYRRQGGSCRSTGFHRRGTGPAGWSAGIIRIMTI